MELHITSLLVPLKYMRLTSVQLTHGYPITSRRSFRYFTHGALFSSSSPEQSRGKPAGAASAVLGSLGLRSQQRAAPAAVSYPGDKINDPGFTLTGVCVF